MNLSGLGVGKRVLVTQRVKSRILRNLGSIVEVIPAGTELPPEKVELYYSGRPSMSLSRSRYQRIVVMKDNGSFLIGRDSMLLTRNPYCWVEVI